MKGAELWRMEVFNDVITICKLIDRLIRNEMKNYSYFVIACQIELKIGRQRFSMMLIMNLHLDFVFDRSVNTDRSLSIYRSIRNLGNW